MRKTLEPIKLGRGTGGGTNGSDVVMIYVSLRDVVHGPDGGARLDGCESAAGFGILNVTGSRALSK